MLSTGLCRNCGVPASGVLCATCSTYQRCSRCYRYLPIYLYSTDSDVCNACQNRDKNNIGRYCLDRVIGDRTWYATPHDFDVTNFLQQLHDEITSTFQSAINEHVAVKYFFEMKVEFYRTGQDGDVQFTTARFYIPPMT